jgi:hypothetical protein
MSDEIRNSDEHHGRAMAWHKKTVVNPLLSLGDENFYLKRWDAEGVVSRFFADDGTEIPLPTGTIWKSLVVREDKGKPEFKPIFVSTPYDVDTYSPIFNSKFVDLVAEALAKAGLPLNVESVGSVFDRRRVFLSVKLPEVGEFKVGKREFKGFLNFINSFDMSTPLFVNTSNTCTVCNNTLTMNLNEGGFELKHTKNALVRLDKFSETVAKAVTVQREFSADFLRMENREINESVARGLFVSFLRLETISTRAENMIDRLVELYKTGAGNSGATLADWLSSVTDYYSHESAGENPVKQFISSEHAENPGSGMGRKQAGLAFCRAILNNSKPSQFIRSLADAGNKIWDERDAE